FISTLLSLSIVLSFTVSICSMSTMEKMCDEMMMDHSSMMDMEHSSDHGDMGDEKSSPDSSDCLMTIDCDCTVESVINATVTPNVLLKTNISPVIASLFETNVIDQNTSPSNSNLSIQNSYSPPPLFLANEAFLI
ncbi:MAG: hypothetical protein ABJ356_01745, partial [Balneola sp.]